MVVVEGTLDDMAVAIVAIRSDQADRYCPVTQSGRELSATQLYRVLSLHHNPPLIAFDGDAAGRESTVRLVRRVADRGCPRPGGQAPRWTGSGFAPGGEGGKWVRRLRPQRRANHLPRTGHQVTSGGPVGRRNQTDHRLDFHTLRSDRTVMSATPVSPVAVTWVPIADRGRRQALLRMLFVEQQREEQESVSDERAS